MNSPRWIYIILETKYRTLRQNSCGGTCNGLELTPRHHHKCIHELTLTSTEEAPHTFQGAAASKNNCQYKCLFRTCSNLAATSPRKVTFPYFMRKIKFASECQPDQQALVAVKKTRTLLNPRQGAGARVSRLSIATLTRRFQAPNHNTCAEGRQKEQLYSELHSFIRSVPAHDKVILLGDFNA